MLETGEYLIQFYNRVGARIKDISEVETTLTGAREAGEDTIILEEIYKDSRAVSFTVDRRIFNSLDKYE